MAERNERLFGKGLRRAAGVVLVAWLGASTLSILEGAQADTNDTRPREGTKAAQVHYEPAVKLQQDPSMNSGSDVTVFIEGFTIATILIGGTALAKSGLNGTQSQDVSGMSGVHDAIGLDDYTISRFARITAPQAEELRWIEHNVLADFFM